MKKRTNIDMSLGDAIDRCTIQFRKVAFGEQDAAMELSYLLHKIEKLGVKLTARLLQDIIGVCYNNFEVWNLENAFRRGEDIPAQDVKEMMILVRHHNSKRIHHKNEINRHTEMGFREFKIQHRSR